MLFDVYKPWKDKDGKLKPGVTAHPTTIDGILDLFKSDETDSRIAAFREGQKDAKSGLAAVCWMGTTTTGKRRAAAMKPTQFCSVDIDHCEDAGQAFAEINAKLMQSGEQLALAHITPSGNGLRLVVRCTADVPSIEAYLKHLDSICDFNSFGKFDFACRDLSRLSFVGRWNEVLYINRDILSGAVTYDVAPIEAADDSAAPEPVEVTAKADTFSEKERDEFASRTYRGTDYQTIIKKYVEVFGEPGSGEVHNYYNEMVKNFRCICDNDKRFLLYILPKFGHSEDECWSQIVSICRVNTLSRLPKPFYFFLKDNGFYDTPFSKGDSLTSYMMSEEEPQNTDYLPPYLPPVFRELVSTAPKDFVVPCINALLPILGTLTSYIRGTYPYDNREHSPSFFSVIYAPAGTGKGFVERFLDLLFEDLKLRDFIQSERENVYLRALQTKGANDKAPDQPHVSLRIIPPKNSEAEFLQKQRDNHGYHMFTYAAEMDSWAKGVRAAGGNKDDMIRIAWDNGEYGQQFKSFNTFKGTVRLYWNVLITGTIAQVDSYFKNVENGLVTRCSFTPIENQEFSMPPQWKKLGKRALENIKKFTDRCDRRTYASPCNFDMFDIESVSDDEFDEKIDWHFKFRDPIHVDMDWIMPIINAFNDEQVKLAALDVDRARDVFRRRAAVRGFRLGLICYGLWENPKPSDLQKCCKFIDWWMHKDLESSLKLWGERYNELTDKPVHVVQRSVYDNLGDDFSRSDVLGVCLKQGIRTPVRRIIHEWVKIGYIKKLDKDNFKKIK